MTRIQREGEARLHLRRPAADALEGDVDGDGGVADAGPELSDADLEGDVADDGEGHAR
jgi:hypothetical protein